MRRLRLAGLFLFAIGWAFLIYAGIQIFVFNQYNNTIQGLEWVGFVLGIPGALIIRIRKKPITKQNPS